MSDASTTTNTSALLKTSAFKVPGEGSSFYISLTTCWLVVTHQESQESQMISVSAMGELT